MKRFADFKTGHPSGRYHRLAQICPACDQSKKRVKVAVVGKYIDLQDAYKSIYESLTPRGGRTRLRHRLSCAWTQEDIETEPPDKYLKNVAGILVPGGFGDRGIEGKIRAVTLRPRE